MFPLPISFLQITKKVMLTENFPPSPSCVVIHSGMPRSSVGDAEASAKEAIASQTLIQMGTEKSVDANGCFFSVHMLIIAPTKPGPSNGPRKSPLILARSSNYWLLPSNN